MPGLRPSDRAGGSCKKQQINKEDCVGWLSLRLLLPDSFLLGKFRVGWINVTAGELWPGLLILLNTGEETRVVGGFGLDLFPLPARAFALLSFSLRMARAFALFCSSLFCSGVFFILRSDQIITTSNFTQQSYLKISSNLFSWVFEVLAFGHVLWRNLQKSG